MGGKPSSRRTGARPPLTARGRPTRRLAQRGARVGGSARAGVRAPGPRNAPGVLGVLCAPGAPTTRAARAKRARAASPRATGERATRRRNRGRPRHPPATADAGPPRSPQRPPLAARSKCLARPSVLFGAHHGHRHSHERLELLAGPVHPHPQARERVESRRGTPPAARGHNGRADTAPPSPAGPATARPPPQRSQRANSPQAAQASRRARPVLFTTQRTRRPAPAAAQRTRSTSRVRRTRPGVVATAVHDLEGRPSGPLLGAGGVTSGPPPGGPAWGRGSRARRGRLAPGPLGRHLPGAPGGRPLLVVRLVVGVEDDGGRQCRQRGEGGGPGAQRPPPARRVPAVGQQRHRGPTREPARQLLGPPDARGRARGAPAPRPGHPPAAASTSAKVGGRRQPRLRRHRGRGARPPRRQQVAGRDLGGPAPGRRCAAPGCRQLPNHRLGRRPYSNASMARPTATPPTRPARPRRLGGPYPGQRAVAARHPLRGSTPSSTTQPARRRLSSRTDGYRPRPLRPSPRAPRSRRACAATGTSGRTRTTRAGPRAARGGANRSLQGERPPGRRPAASPPR